MRHLCGWFKNQVCGSSHGKSIATIVYLMLSLVAIVSFFAWMLALTPGGIRHEVGFLKFAVLCVLCILIVAGRLLKDFQKDKYVSTVLKALCFTGLLLIAMGLAFNLGLHGLKVEFFKSRYFEGESFFTAYDRTISLDRVHEQFYTFPQYDFSVTWSGWIRIPRDGQFVITTHSDDGSDLFIDGKLLLNNYKANHVLETTVELTKGFNPIYISYSQGGGPYEMSVFWITPGSTVLERISGTFFYPEKPKNWQVFSEIILIPASLLVIMCLLLLFGAFSMIRLYRSSRLLPLIRWSLPRFAMLLLSTIIALAVVEIGLRLMQMSQQSRIDLSAELQRSEESPLIDSTGPTLHIGGLVRPSASPDIVYELKPLNSGVFINRKLQTNSLGMRDQEYTVEKPPATYRIVGLGDSIMFGWGVHEEDSFLSVVEKNLASVLSGKRYEVLNMAVPGYNTALEAFVLRDKAIALKPDLVIVHFVSNDFNLPNFMQTPLSFTRLRRLELFKTVNSSWNFFLGKRIDPLIGMDLKDRFGATEEEITNDPTIPDTFKSIAGVPGFERATELMGRLSREEGFPVVIAAQAFPSQLPVIRRQCEKHDLLFFDMGEAVARYIDENQITDKQNFRVDPHDSHPNEKAHFIMGKVLEKWLRDNLPGDIF